MCICMSLHVPNACSSLQRPEEVVGCPGTGITDSSEVFNVGAWSSRRVASTPNY